MSISISLPGDRIATKFADTPDNTGLTLATWNVNSVRARRERILDFIERCSIDILAFQELKCRDDQFPTSAFNDLGYEVAVHGQGQWNGVAIASRVGLSDIEIGFPNQPEWEGQLEARAIKATCAGIDIWSLYVPNGRELDHPHYAYKLAWLSALYNHLDQRLQTQSESLVSSSLALAPKIVLAGDWNIAPLDSDVWDVEFFRGATHISDPERAAFAAFAQLGFIEVTRRFFNQYTYWDYRDLRFPRNQGMRIDFMQFSAALATAVTASRVERDERKGKGASDHAPVIVQLDLTD